MEAHYRRHGGKTANFQSHRCANDQKRKAAETRCHDDRQREVRLCGLPLVALHRHLVVCTHFLLVLGQVDIFALVVYVQVYVSGRSLYRQESR